GAEELAALATSTPAKSNPDLLAKLASGVFDSDDEEEEEDKDKHVAESSGGDMSVDEENSRDIASETKASTVRPLKAEALSSEEVALAKERERMASILGKVLGGDVAPFAETGVSKPAVSLDVEEEEEESSSMQDGSDGGSDGKKRADGKDASDSSGSSSSSDSDSDSESGSDSSEDGSASFSGSGSGSDSGDDDSNDEKNAGKDSSDSDSSDSESDSESDSDSDSDSESVSEKYEDAQDDMMDVDTKDETESAGGLFGSGGGGGALFGAPAGGFRFTDALGLEADEPSALGQTAPEEHQAPVTGGARMAGEPIERNLNANRLPPFFADVDAITFKRPEPAFQRQRTEEELQDDLDKSRSRLAREFKSQHQASARQARKLQEKRRLK
ncbi:hypothetical protein LPJ56_002104, partial [Coemansia sp. RSA 2599]